MTPLLTKILAALTLSASLTGGVVAYQAYGSSQLDRIESKVDAVSSRVDSIDARMPPPMRDARVVARRANDIAAMKARAGIK